MPAQTIYNLRQKKIALPGTTGAESMIMPFRNGASTIQDLWTIALGTITGSTDYIITVTLPNATTVSVTVNSASLTATQLRDALIAAIQANGVFYGALVPAVASASSFTLTSRLYGTAYPIAISVVTNFTATNTTPATASGAIPFGRIVARKSTDNDGYCRLPNASSDPLIGVSCYAEGIEMSSYNDLVATTQWERDRIVPVVQSGPVIVECEDAITTGSTLYFRHTANGGFTKLGILSGASGTGKATLPAGFKLWVEEDSITCANGLLGVPVRIALNY